MLGVMCFRQFLADLHELRADKAQSAALKTGKDLADQTSLHAIGFY
jgi:hypothetical protein